MPPLDYDITHAHITFKQIVDRLKEQKISRDDIHDRIKVQLNKMLTKSTITRLYNDPSPGKIHNLKLILRYTEWIKTAYTKELGLEIDEPADDYGQLQRSINLQSKDIKTLIRLSRAIMVRQARSKYRRRPKGGKKN